MSDSNFLALAAGLFLLGCAAHWAGYQRFLRPALRSADLDSRRRLLLGWGWYAGAVEVVAVLFAVAWFLAWRGRGRGDALAWAAPPAGVLLGTGVPLQLLVAGAARLLRG